MTKKIATYSFDQIKDELIGEQGTLTRDQYEFDLKLDLLGEIIKTVRQERNLTQEQLGALVGVQKAQISRLERNASNVTVATILKVFKALQTTVSFKVQLTSDEVILA